MKDFTPFLLLIICIILATKADLLIAELRTMNQSLKLISEKIK